MLSVHIETASPRQFQCVPTTNAPRKNKENYFEIRTYHNQASYPLCLPLPISIKKPGLEVIKLIFMLNSAEDEISTAN